MEIAAYLKLKKLKENTEKQLKGILKKQPTFGIDVNIQAPIIFIPENPRLYYSSRTLKLILGSLRITSSDPNIGYYFNLYFLWKDFLLILLIRISRALYFI